jgi:uncharacterized membrane protein YbaN (DUF454 family)
MPLLKAVGQGLVFVVLIMLSVVVTVRWGLIGILLATVVFFVVAAVVFGRRSPHDEKREKSGHDWYEV